MSKTMPREVTLGETDVRKEKLDQIFKTTLVISF